MRSFVLTSVLLLTAALAGAQTVPQQQAPPDSQIPAEPGTPTTTPPTFPRAQQLPPEQPGAPAQMPDQAAPPNNSISTSTPLTIEGCLSGSSGNFSLTDESRGTFQLIGADRQLTQQVGHTVRVTGTAMNASGAARETPGVSAKPEQEENETEAQMGNPAPDNGPQTLRVDTVKVMSRTCNDVPQR